MLTIEFRSTTADEKRTIIGRIDGLLGDGVASKVIGDTEVVVARGKRTEIFLAPSEIMSVFRRTQAKRNPYCLGVYLGDITNDDFLLSIEGATLCTKHTKRRVRVTDKGEQVVLYGRDLTRALVGHFPPFINKGEKVVVINKLDETLALGKALVDGNRYIDVDEKELVVENILDRGWYLRKGT
jgi:ribosome biogenesis protein Nip4